MTPRSWKLALAAAVFAAAASAQVATKANQNYQTPEGRKAIAAGLSNPERDQQQRPGVLIHEMGLQPGMTVADVGTGIGYMLPFLSKRAGPQGHVIAEDIFDDFLSAARQAADTQGLTNVTFVKGTETSPNLPEAQVDMALVLDVYHHFNYPEKMLAGLHQGLKPGGKLVIVEYYKRESAMKGGGALTHIRLDMPDVIKEVEANHFHLLEEKELARDVQYMLILERN
ncbi:MAG TPA: methyltransferase domain-containing protein [Bryobacteraceae bacterium]|nr:methyltransferase domain-containing protein [Bryobacteraceae bacterium]